jgi:hypothetical protein
VLTDLLAASILERSHHLSAKSGAEIGRVQAQEEAVEMD